MAPFKHSHMILSTNFELEPVIEEYLQVYPEAQPRRYDIACKLRDERHEGDYAYIIVFEYATGRQTPSLGDYLKSYCTLHDKLVAGNASGHVFPDIAEPTYGRRTK